MDKWLYRFNRWLALPRKKKDRIINRWCKFRAQHVGPPYESDPKVYDEMRAEQLAINRFNQRVAK